MLLTRVSQTVYMSSRHFLLTRALVSWRQAVATGKHQLSESWGHVQHFKTTYKKLLLWIREQQAFKLPLSTPEGGPAVFHCCVERIYLFISQLLFRLEREKKKKTLASEGVWQSTGVRGSFSFIFIYIYSLHSQENEMAGKGSRH